MYTQIICVLWVHRSWQFCNCSEYYQFVFFAIQYIYLWYCCRKNYINLKIFYKDLKTTITEQIPKYKTVGDVFCKYIHRTIQLNHYYNFVMFLYLAVSCVCWMSEWLLINTKSVIFSRIMASTLTIIPPMKFWCVEPNMYICI